MELNKDLPKTVPVRMVTESGDVPGMPLYFQFDDDEPVQFATVPIMRVMPLITIDTRELSEMRQDPGNPMFYYIVHFSSPMDKTVEHTFKIFHVYNGINEHLVKKPELTAQE